jgi:hypothetical protein
VRPAHFALPARRCRERKTAKNVPAVADELCATRVERSPEALDELALLHAARLKDGRRRVHQKWEAQADSCVVARPCPRNQGAPAKLSMHSFEARKIQYGRQRWAAQVLVSDQSYWWLKTTTCFASAG